MLHIRRSPAILAVALSLSARPARAAAAAIASALAIYWVRRRQSAFRAHTRVE